MSVHGGQQRHLRRSRSPDRVGRAALLVLSMRRLLTVEQDWLRLAAAATIGMVATSLLICAGLTDRYFHRGVSTGEELPAVYLPTGRDLATNVDLRSLSVQDIGRVATALQANNFRIVRQPVFWSEIEPNQGEQVWDQYDAIMTELEARDISVLAVVQGTPAWARSPTTDESIDGPPENAAEFARFLSNFVQRYSDDVDFVQVWELPNQPSHWGGRNTSPGDYVSLLAAAHDAIQSANPDTLTVLAELDARPPSGALDDLTFLSGIYASGGASYFDIVATTLDGGGHSPYDRQVDSDRLNLSRVILVRELMEQMDDAATPVWGTRFGWRAGEPPGGVTTEQQATFVGNAMERARSEWPWLGVLFNWAFLPEAGTTESGYALLTSDGKATPLFTRLAEFGANAGGIAGVGFVPTTAQAVGLTGGWQAQPLPPRLFQTTNEMGATVRVVFDGTGLIVTLRVGPNAGTIDATVDGAPLPGWTGSSLRSFQAADLSLSLVDGLEEGRHEVMLTLKQEGELTVGGFIVVRDLPFLWPVALLAFASVALMAFAIWQGIIVVSTRWGIMRRRRGDDVWLSAPELPSVPAVRRL